MSSVLGFALPVGLPGGHVTKLAVWADTFRAVAEIMEYVYTSDA